MGAQGRHKACPYGDFREASLQNLFRLDEGKIEMGVSRAVNTVPLLHRHITSVIPAKLVLAEAGSGNPEGGGVVSFRA